MAQDYNIYLHNLDGGGDNKPTKPKREKNKKTQPTELDKIAKKFSKVAGFISNPDSMIGEAKSTALKEAGPIGIILAAVVGVVNSVTDKSTELYAMNTGDYQGVRNWNYFRSSVKMALTPVSTAMSIFTETKRIELYNQKQKQQQLLLGDSQINQNYERKV